MRVGLAEAPTCVIRSRSLCEGCAARSRKRDEKHLIENVQASMHEFHIQVIEGVN
jgi:hypothetical protein